MGLSNCNTSLWLWWISTTESCQHDRWTNLVVESCFNYGTARSSVVLFCKIFRHWHFLQSLKGKKKTPEEQTQKPKHRQVFSPSPRLYRRRTSHACRASLLSKPSRAAWFRQRMARVKATPSYHCAASSPQISSKVKLAFSLLPWALSDLSL